MKKIILLFMFLFLFGCELSNNPSSKVSAYLDNYNVLSDEVLENIEVKSSNEGLNNENRNLYKNVLKREYETLKYDIKDVSINGNQAKVIAKINGKEYTIPTSDPNGLHGGDGGISYVEYKFKQSETKVLPTGYDAIL